MRKAPALLLIPFIIMALCSCASTSRKAPSEAQCRYALGFALSEAQERTLSEMFKTVSEFEDVVPEGFRMIDEFKDEIPGMDYLIGDWTSYLREFLINCLDGFSDLTNRIVSHSSFPEGTALVAKGNSSASELMRSEHQAEIRTFFLEYMAGMDTTLWNRITSHYSCWITTTALLGTDEAQGLPDDDIHEALADMMCDLYFETLSHQEELFRTTPDPYSDEITALVFGLR